MRKAGAWSRQGLVASPQPAGWSFPGPPSNAAVHARSNAGLVDPDGFDDFRVVIGESGLRPNKG